MTEYYLCKFRLTLLILFISLASIVQGEQPENPCVYSVPPAEEICKSGAIKVSIKEDKPALFSAPSHVLQKCIANKISNYFVPVCQKKHAVTLDRVTISGWYEDKLYYVGLISAKEDWRLVGVSLLP